MDQALRNAAEQGNIEALYSSIAGDPKVLDKIDEIPFVETPLHVAAAAGQTQFAMEIMMLKPSFAKKLNAMGFTPLLLAVCNDQTDLVLELLDVHKDLVLAQGRGCMNPLHYAAQMGNVKLLIRFLRVCPKLIDEVTSQSETALHIALKSDKIDACLVLVEWLRRAWFRNAAHWQRKLLNWMDVNQNTLLHIASDKNEAQVVRRLLDCKVYVNVKNSSGFTVLDIVEKQTHVANQEIKKMLLRAGALRASHVHEGFSWENYLKSPFRINEKLFVWFFRKRMKLSIDIRNLLLVVAVLLVTIAYQGVLSPPGGYWQDNSIPGSNNQFNSAASIGDSNEVSQAPHFAGTVTMAGYLFHLLFAINSLTFYIPLLLIMLAIPHGTYGGLITISIVLLFLSYGISISIITPFPSHRLWHLLSFSFFLVLNLVFYVVVTWKHKHVFWLFQQKEERYVFWLLQETEERPFGSLKKQKKALGHALCPPLV